MKLIEDIRRRNQVVRAVLYARYSSDMQREESAEAQIRAMRQFADSNKIMVVGEYIDRARTGTQDDREQFQRMVKDGSKKEFDLVLVHKMDRFARNRKDSINYKIDLKRNGISVIATSQPFDSESPEGMMMEAMLEAMAEYYSRNLATEVEKGKRENALKGLHVGGSPPLGYDLNLETRKLVINEREAEAVRIIFQMAADDATYKEISDALNERGFRNKKGNRFGKNSLHETLRNEKYMGTYTCSKSAPKSVDGTRNDHAYKDDSEIVRVKGAVPAIVDEETFMKIQRRLKSRTKYSKGGKVKAIETYLLSGKLYCGECGAKFEGMRRKPCPSHPLRVSYRCSKFNHTVDCNNNEIGRDLIEGHVLKKLSEVVFDDSLIPTISEAYSDYLAHIHRESSVELGQLKTNIGLIKREIDNITSAIAQTGSLALADKLKSLEEEQLHLDGRILEIESELGNSRISEAKIKKAFAEARELIHSGELPGTKRLVNTFVDRVYLYKDKVEISFDFGLPTNALKREIPHHAARQSKHETVSVAPPSNGGAHVYKPCF